VVAIQPTHRGNTREVRMSSYREETPTDPGASGSVPVPTSNSLVATGWGAIRKYFRDFRVLGDNPLEFWATQIVNLFDSFAYFGMLTIITLFLGPEGTLHFSEASTGYIVTGFTSFITVVLFFAGFVTDAWGVKPLWKTPMPSIGACRAALSRSRSSSPKRCASSPGPESPWSA